MYSQSGQEGTLVHADVGDVPRTDSLPTVSPAVAISPRGLKVCTVHSRELNERYNNPQVDSRARVVFASVLPLLAH